jgi:hypothetical protein
MKCSRALLLCVTGLSSALAAGGGTITAVPLPNPQITGFNFPESEATILTWAYDLGNNTPGAAAAFTNLHLHGWGLWAALTMQTSQLDNRMPLRVFETWYTPQEVDQIPIGSSPASLTSLPRQRSTLRNFVQFEHGLEPRPQPQAPASDGNETVFGYVKFDPTAAAHLVKENLLSAATLNQLMQGGAQQIPVFPKTALTLKSAFQIITAQALVEGRYYRLNVWTGPPQTPQAWGPAQWPGVVWIDIAGGGSGAGQVDMVASADGSSRTSATTYPVSDMIFHRLSALEAQEFNQGQPGQNAAAGDYAVLVAMHVAGREIARWTWQTFWWTPTPDNPRYPSSTEIAALRPAMLSGATRMYAMSLGYDMITPGQPNVGGENAGLGLYAYNPYLEARFGPSNLPDSLPGTDPFGRPAANNVGTACNCMSCHMRANYNPGKLATAPRYSGSRYTSMDDPQFNGTLQVDLLWSIQELAK